MPTSTPDSPHLLSDGKYELLSPAGTGGMGVVWLARHVALDRTVAVKTLRPRDGKQTDLVQRFAREAQLASLLRHRNTVQVLDFGVDADEGMFLVMEYVEGANLYDVLGEEGRLSVPRALSIAVQVLAALAAAHDLAIIHRDVKAGNVMLVPWVDDDGRETELVKVFDFGIATMRPLHKRDPMRSEVISGTPEYMSPEQVQGLQVDARSDVYAVGVLLYVMLTGRLPFEDESPIDVMYAQLERPPRSLRELDPTIPEALDALVLRALAKDPAARFPSARNFRAALLALMEQGTARPPSDIMLAAPQATAPVAAALEMPLAPAEPMARAPRRSSGLMWALAAVVALGVGFGVVRMLGASDDAPSARVETVASTPMASAPTPAAANPSPPSDPPAAVASLAPPPSEKPAPTPIEKPAPTPALEPAPALITAPVAVPAPVEVAAKEPATKPAKPGEKPAPRAGVDAPKATTPAVLAASTAPPTATAPSTVTATSVVAPAVTPPPTVAVTPPPAVAAARDGGRAGPDLHRQRRLQRPHAAGLRCRAARWRAPSTWCGAASRICYHAAAVSCGHDGAASANVSFAIDVDGRARDVVVGALPMPGLASCAAGVIGGVRVKDRPDTGTVSGQVQLSFSPRSP
ncbi:MAG: protein kinase [Myxococcota bacterium]